MFDNISVQNETQRIKFLMSEQIFLGGPSMGISSAKNVLNTIDWIRSWDKHDWLNFVELTSVILAAIPQPFAPITSPILLGISTGAGIANAKLYYDEGDKYTAGLILAFSVIPGGELIKTLRQSKTFMKLGPKKSIELLKSIKSKSAIAAEQKMGQELIKEVAPQASELAKQTLKYTIKKSLQELPKMTLGFILKLCIGMSKLGVFGIREGIVVAGTFFTYDKIYKALNYKNEKNLSIRQKNELVKIYNILWGKKDEIKQQLLEEIKSVEPQILKNPEKFLSIDTTYEIKFE